MRPKAARRGGERANDKSPMLLTQKVFGYKGDVWRDTLARDAAGLPARGYGSAPDLSRRSQSGHDQRTSPELLLDRELRQACKPEAHGQICGSSVSSTDVTGRTTRAAPSATIGQRSSLPVDGYL